jgi:hypothetical protein
MSKMTKTPLQLKFEQLPRFVSFIKDIKPELDKAGISRSTFDRDRKADPDLIPYGRLRFYTELFNCEIQELVCFEPKRIGIDMRV